MILSVIVTKIMCFIMAAISGYIIGLAIRSKRYYFVLFYIVILAISFKIYYSL